MERETRPPEFPQDQTQENTIDENQVTAENQEDASRTNPLADLGAATEDRGGFFDKTTHRVGEHLNNAKTATTDRLGQNVDKAATRARETADTVKEIGGRLPEFLEQTHEKTRELFDTASTYYDAHELKRFSDELEQLEGEQLGKNERMRALLESEVGQAAVANIIYEDIKGKGEMVGDIAAEIAKKTSEKSKKSQAIYYLLKGVKFSTQFAHDRLKDNAGSPKELQELYDLQQDVRSRVLSFYNSGTPDNTVNGKDISPNVWFMFHGTKELLNRSDIEEDQGDVEDINHE